MKKKSFTLRPITNKYSSNRADLISFIKYISKKLRLTTKTYYMSIVFVDKILLTNVELKPIITTVCCILLAGNIIL